MSRAERIEPEDMRDRPKSRIRASEAAIKAALKALREAGMHVDKVCVTGGQVEIHCAPVAGAAPAENDDGFEQW